MESLREGSEMFNPTTSSPHPGFSIVGDNPAEIFYRIEQEIKLPPHDLFTFGEFKPFKSFVPVLETTRKAILSQLYEEQIGWFMKIGREIPPQIYSYYSLYGDGPRVDIVSMPWEAKVWDESCWTSLKLMALLRN